MHSDELERALAARVAGLVEGRGIPRARVSAAVRQVVAALRRDAAPRTSEATMPSDHAATPLVLAALAAARPDLASATRAACSVAGVSITALGTGAAGRHTVVTLLVPAAARAALAAVAQSVGAAVTLLDAPAA